MELYNNWHRDTIKYDPYLYKCLILARGKGICCGFFDKPYPRWFIELVLQAFLEFGCKYQIDIQMLITVLKQVDEVEKMPWLSSGEQFDVSAIASAGLWIL